MDRLGLKGSKKKRSKKLDEDWMVRVLREVISICERRFLLQPILKPLALKEVPKVIQAMRQTQSRKVLVKLLTRIKVRLLGGGYLSRALRPFFFFRCRKTSLLYAR